MIIELDKYKNIERTQARYVRDVRADLDDIVTNLTTYQEKIKREVWDRADPEIAASRHWDDVSTEDMEAIDDLVIMLQRWTRARIMIRQVIESLQTIEDTLLGNQEGGSHD